MNDQDAEFFNYGWHSGRLNILVEHNFIDHIVHLSIVSHWLLGSRRSRVIFVNAQDLDEYLVDASDRPTVSLRGRGYVFIEEIDGHPF
jgi:hypothetical protein